MITSARRTSLAASAALCVLWLGGCGYTQKEVFPENIGTIAVPIFENRTFYRGVEFELTEAIKKELERRTNYKVTTSSTADTRLSGTVVRIEQKQVARRRPGGLPQEMEVTMQVDFQWVDVRRNETLRQRRGFVSVGRYVSTDPFGETLSVAQHQAIERLADRIVSTMRSDW